MTALNIVKGAILLSYRYLSQLLYFQHRQPPLHHHPTGTTVWNAILPYGGPNDIGYGVISGNPTQDPQNPLNIAMIQMPGVLLALDGTTGSQKWQWPIPFNSTISSLTSWGDTVGILLEGPAVQSPYFPIAISPTYILSLDSETGQQRWQLNTTSAIPKTQADSATYLVETLLAVDSYLMFSRGNKLAAINSVNGTIQWQSQVALEGSVGVGQGANITGMAYVPAQSGEYVFSTPPGLLINANNWGFQRFVFLNFNTTNTSGTIRRNPKH